MLRRYCANSLLILRRLSHTQTEITVKPSIEPSQYQVIDTSDLPEDDYIDVKFEQKSVLEDCNEDISHIAPYLQPSFNFAAYVNKSETLQQLVKLGVDLHKLEKKVKVPPYILKLDFEKDIKNHVIFLSDLGVANEELGNFISKNPFIFQEDLDNLQVRVNYLKSKKFSDPMVTRIVSCNPFWLIFSTQRIDRRLGFFQKHFFLTGDEVRQLTVQQPRIITYNIRHIKLNDFAIREEMGFSAEETKSILLKKPYVFMKGRDHILKTFEFIHKNMNMPLERIAEFPEVLTCREFKIKQRYTFLEKLGRIQFNPRKPNYVSLLSLVSGSDAEFCDKVAKSSVQAYNTFLKTL
ncbi:hypothetical protein ILUMI_06258 [Ignelater luminosus]|uniref:Transcription termination factor 3, mitochondrial n=1 Tax=Ignelater luminosus TaxID=2038154 RepID=A0A8K0D635_IGNLU|nr:hypothetical protein ILUMI_06258 [Ignelater luminosus]